MKHYDKLQLIEGKESEIANLNIQNVLFYAEDTNKFFIISKPLVKEITSGSSGGGGGDIFFDYSDLYAMVTDQANQADQVVYAVADASDDPSLNFAHGETRLQGFYRFNGVATGNLINDYTLISAPYATIGSGGVPDLQEVTDEGRQTTNPITVLASNNAESKYIRIQGIDNSFFSITSAEISPVLDYGIKYKADRIVSVGDVAPYLVRGQYIFPDLGDNNTERYLPVSVNGEVADVNGNITIDTNSEKDFILLKSPNETVWKIEVDDLGVISATEA